MKSFQSANVEHLRAAVISHICAEIETFLRLEVHVNLQIIEASNDSRNTMDIVMKCDEYKQWIHSYPMHLNHSYISIGYRIENYLSVMFYNLTTISLHDWKTYEEMRHLAEKRFHINALDDYLPNQSLDQVSIWLYIATAFSSSCVPLCYRVSIYWRLCVKSIHS